MKWDFLRPISDQTSDDTLCIEVWDFDPAESVKEKLGKIFGVKGVRGIRKLVKEIAVTAATGQHENELVGKAKIPLKVNFEPERRRSFAWVRRL